MTHVEALHKHDIVDHASANNLLLSSENPESKRGFLLRFDGGEMAASIRV